MINILRYKESLEFLKKYNNISYPEFDYYSVHNLNLFSSFEDLNLVEVEKEVTRIEKVLPSMKRIFARPIIHLIDVDEIVNVESAKRINSKTISYAATHSELWDNITEDGIKPLKLLTSTYKDNYAIYENVVFSRAVDYAVSFTKYYSRLLRDVIYTNKTLEIDLLERENHISYYLALGKLETGHLRSFSAYIDLALSLISRVDFIYNTLHSRLNRPIYQKCHKVKGKLKLRKTNILGMQKDYKNIYAFLKSAHKDELEDVENEEESYYYFCKYLLVFSIGHFNFAIDNNKKIDFNKLDLDFEFKTYKLSVKDVLVSGKKAIELTFKNDIEYKMYLLPSFDGNIKLESNENVRILTDNFDSTGVHISISNIDSFRRIQQLLLTGMIYSTTSFKICPFCGGEFEERDGLHYCHSCREEIQKLHCPETDKDYYVSTIGKYRLRKEEDESPLMNKSSEGMLHFRNITDITNDGSFICPHCHKVHKEENQKEKSS